MNAADQIISDIAEHLGYRGGRNLTDPLDAALRDAFNHHGADYLLHLAAAIDKATWAHFDRARATTQRTYTITNLVTDDQVTADDNDHVKELITSWFNEPTDADLDVLDEMDHPPAFFDVDDWRLAYFGIEITTP